MLQDLQAGREIEIEAVLRSISQLGRMTATPCPTIDAVYACAKFLGHTLRKAGYLFRGVEVASRH